MDFHSLTRRDLQSLCKLNKIPANLTNIAMADALQSLQIVVGIDEFLKDASSETTADLVPSPKAPLTRCRTSTRQKAKSTETERLPCTVTRTTRRGSKQLPPTEVDESKLQTPAISSYRNVSYRLNECENEAKEESNKYSTRRSTRLTEKKTAKGTGKAVVEIGSFLDVTSNEPEEEVHVETEVGDICNAFEKLDVLAMDEVVNNLKQQETSNSSEDSLKISEVKTDQVYDVKPESDGPSDKATQNSVEDDQKLDSDENLGLELDLENSFMSAMKETNEDDNLEKIQMVETFDSLKENSFGAAAAESGQEDTLCAESEITKGSSTMAIDDTENPIDEIATNKLEENNVDETIDVIPISEEAEDLKPVLITENNVNETLVKKATLFEVMPTDDKENIVDEEQIGKKEKDEMVNISIRQLKKQLKALTLKNLNSKEEAVAATTRPALQALCENQMVVGTETEN